MTKAEVNDLVPGIYRVFWKAGGESVAAVGVVDLSGPRWLAPINWTTPVTDQLHWRSVAFVRKIM